MWRDSGRTPSSLLLSRARPLLRRLLVPLACQGKSVDCSRLKLASARGTMLVEADAAQRKGCERSSDTDDGSCSALRRLRCSNAVAQMRANDCPLLSHQQTALRHRGSSDSLPRRPRLCGLRRPKLDWVRNPATTRINCPQPLRLRLDDAVHFHLYSRWLTSPQVRLQAAEGARYACCSRPLVSRRYLARTRPTGAKL